MLRFPGPALLVMTLCSGLCSAETLSLEEALRLALANNTAIVNSRLQLEAAGDDVAALRTTRYPRMDISGGVSHTLEDQSYTFDQGVWGTYPGIGEVPAQDITINSADGTSKIWSAGITQPLSQQYRLGLSVEQGEVKEDMAGELVRLTRQDLALVVKQNYFEILQTRNDLVVSREAILFYEKAMGIKPGDRTAYLKIKEANKRKQEQALQPPIACETDVNEFTNILSAITDQRYSSDKLSLCKKYIEKK